MLLFDAFAQQAHEFNRKHRRMRSFELLLFMLIFDLLFFR